MLHSRKILPTHNVSPDGKESVDHVTPCLQRLESHFDVFCDSSTFQVGVLMHTLPTASCIINA